MSERTPKLVTSILVKPNDVKHFKEEYSKFFDGKESPAFLYHSHKYKNWTAYTINVDFSNKKFYNR